MCDPISIAGITTAVSAMSSVAGFIGQSQAAKQNKALAQDSFNETANSLSEQRVQINAQASEDAVTANIDRAQSLGRISATMGSLGGDYATTQAAGHAADFAVGRNLSIEQLNTQNKLAQNTDELVGADLQRQAKIASVPPPSPLSLVAGLGKAGLGGYDAYGNALKAGDNG